jgi:hypothetical protein
MTSIDKADPEQVKCAALASWSALPLSMKINLCKHAILFG